VAKKNSAAKAQAVVRDACLALPEATEVEAWGHPTFRIRNKMFVAMGGGDTPSITFMCDPETQAGFLAAGEPFFWPAYVGGKGWVGVNITHPACDLDDLPDLIRDAYVRTAPKKLGNLVS
jgi:hypothetical protein